MPVLAALAGMATSAAVYVALTAGGGGAAGWGVAISTDTALALGALTIAAGQRLDRLRVFMLTLLVVDDVAALLVISFVYPSRIDVAAVIVAAALLTVLLSIRAIAGRQFRTRGNSTAALIFALANAGLRIDQHLLASAATSPITWGIILAYVVGKPLGIVIASFDGALLDQAKMGILATALLAPALGVAALARLRRRDSAAGVRRNYGLAATSLCTAR